MNNWSTEKIRQVVLVAIGTAAVLGIIWFGAAEPLQRQIKVKADKLSIVDNQIKVTRANIQLAETYKAEVQRGQTELHNLESKMTQGDDYRWVVNYVRDLQTRHDVSVIEPPPPQRTELAVPPKVPYAAVSFTVAGAAHYHEFGAFLADLENSSPFIRLKSLTLQATVPGFAGTTASEKLGFRTEFVTLRATPGQR